MGRSQNQTFAKIFIGLGKSCDLLRRMTSSKFLLILEKTIEAK